MGRTLRQPDADVNSWDRCVVIGRHRRGGDGFVACACGRRHWGRFGAAGLLVRRGDEVLMQHRAAWSHEGGTWAVPGGALDVGETPLQGALREAAEEAAVEAGSIRPRHAWTVDHGTWAYTTLVTEAVGPIRPQRLDGESEELRWVRVRDIAAMPLHSGFAAGWPRIEPLLSRHEVVVVDAANVVGSRPDGWWNDRAGATARLLRQVSALADRGVSAGSALLPDVAGRSAAWPDWVVVAEGAARGAASPSGSQVTVVDAPGSGDDTVVEQTVELANRGRAVTVVTSDRGLRERVRSVGAATVGVGTLTALLGPPE
jgi:8-oxo-dGTP pyrophosphatase MutT (NUDIX family)